MDIIWICVSTLFFITSLTDSIPTVHFVWTNESCIGGERGLLSTGLWLTFNASNHTGYVLCSNHCRIEYNSSREVNLGEYCGEPNDISNATFEFEQPEHGGGLCHCVWIYFNYTTNSSFQ